MKRLNYASPIVGLISICVLSVFQVLALVLCAAQTASANPPELIVPPEVAAARASIAGAQFAEPDYSTAGDAVQDSEYNGDSSQRVVVELSREEAALLYVTNRERQSEGLASLQPDPLLCSLAREHSEDMAGRNYFDHMAPSPGPASPMDRYLNALGYHPAYAFLGENIYYRSVTANPDTSVFEANTAFMNSPGHRANILQPKFTKVGIGIFRDPFTGAFWVTEEFLRDEY